MADQSGYKKPRRYSYMTTRQLKKLDKEAHVLLERITNKVAHCGKVDGNTRKWGQFIDDVGRESGQIGVYGTASATSILGKSESQSKLFKEASMALPGWSGADSVSSFSDESMDLSLKCAAILAAQPIKENLEENQKKLEQKLISMHEPGKGWAYFEPSGDGNNQNGSDLIPTANVIYAWSKGNTQSSMLVEHVNQAYRWLIDTINDAAKLTRLEMAFSLLALSSVAIENLSVNEEQSLKKARARLATDLLSQSKRGWSLRMVEYYEHVHYSAPTVKTDAQYVAGKSHIKNRYMFYPVEVIVALSLLKSPLRQQASSYICAVVGKLISMAKLSGVYIAAPTGREALSDAYWVCEFLSEFRHVVNSDSRSLITPLARAWENPYVAWALLLTSIALCALSVIIANRDPDKWNSTSMILVGVAFPLLLGLVLPRIHKH